MTDKAEEQGFDPWRACLRDPRQERDYRQELLPIHARYAVIILLGVAGVGLLSMLPDLLALRGEPVKLLFNHWLSLLFTGFTLFAAIVIRRIDEPKSFVRTLTIWWLLAFMIICLGNLSYPAGTRLFIVFDILIPVAVYVLFPLGFLRQFCLAWLFTCVDIWVFFSNQPLMDVQDAAFVVFALITAHTIGLICCWQMHLLGRSAYLSKVSEARLLAESYALSEEVQVLRGILPICAYCKQIRDDKGYWHEVEAYLKAHSLADFTHGICPGCLEEHFPKEFVRMRKDGSI